MRLYLVSVWKTKMLRLNGLLLVFVMSSQSLPAQLADDRGSKIGSLHPACEGVVGKDEAETRELRQDCENVFKSEYVKWSEKMLADEEFVRNLEVIDVTDYGKEGDEKTKLPRNKRSVPHSECPVFDAAYLKQHENVPKQLSTSPWKYVVNRDLQRVPVRLIDTVCLCQGCIDMTTGHEDILNLVSVPLELKVPVTKRSKKTTVSVHLGCSCNIAITT